jgi:hypothetical protein
VSAKRTQLDRVLAAARSYRGTCQTDFLAPDVCDGGPPITRVAARIQDLETLGHRFEIIGTRSKTRVYRLLDVEQGRGARPPGVPQPTDGLAAPALPDAEDRLFVLPGQPHWKAA